jgi:CheY-like chemotaxis protein
MKRAAGLDQRREMLDMIGPSQHPPNRQPLRICLAEDYLDLRVMLKQMLTALGHLVVCDAENGQKLLDAIAHEELDLVLLDLDMPVLDGLATAEIIRKQRHLPVILMSGHPDMKHVVVEKEPISICLQKPVSLERLREAIDEATGGQTENATRAPGDRK